MITDMLFEIVSHDPQRNKFKGAISPYPVFHVKFFAIENGVEETRVAVPPNKLQA